MPMKILNSRERGQVSENADLNCSSVCGRRNICLAQNNIICKKPGWRSSANFGQMDEKIDSKTEMLTSSTSLRRLTIAGVSMLLLILDFLEPAKHLESILFAFFLHTSSNDLAVRLAIGSNLLHTHISLEERIICRIWILSMRMSLPGSLICTSAPQQWLSRDEIWMVS
ncbi:uncharacterized protein LOC135152920 isoform X1 [Daucus carota subsp. sativus]|uniref:uncharacterized protein LOC135152920 isoform X1 n=1 Tax=Daucus carota subsp. sativus TaxID=79200 RepID=UPI003083ADCC